MEIEYPIRMKVIFQVNYPVKLIATGIDLKIRKIFSDHIKDPNYETGGGSGFGIREVEAEVHEEYVTADVVQGVEDDIRAAFYNLNRKLNYEYNSQVSEPKQPPDLLPYKYLRIISFTFN